MLDPKFKKKWIAALRSGDYDQGKGALCRVTKEGAKYCCLGVAYEILHGEDSWEQAPINPEENVLRPIVPDANGTRSTGYWSPPGYTSQLELANKNDEGWTFEQIADFIEKEA